MDKQTQQTSEDGTPSNIDIDHLAGLARLHLDTSVRNNALQDLAGIIQMIDRMQSVDTSTVEPMAHPMDANQRLREDIVSDAGDRDAFQANAPETRDGFYLVPQVVEQAGE